MGELAKENRALKNQLKELEAKIADKDRQIAEKEQEVSALSHKVNILQALYFGPKSEKKTKDDERQGSLFDEAEVVSAVGGDTKRLKKTKKVRVPEHEREVPSEKKEKPFAENLPREEKVYDIPEDKRTCSCGSNLKYIGSDNHEHLEIIPAKVIVIKEITHKYACEDTECPETEETAVKTAEKEKRLIHGGRVGNGLVAWSLKEKFEDALPFYRQEKRLQYIGADISRANLANWAVRAGEKCRPIIRELEKHITSGEVLGADETPVQVLKENGRKAESKSWMWVLKGGPPDKPGIIFRYDTSRGSEVPTNILENFSGWLQSDDYGAYATALKRLNTERDENTRISHVLCWAHARRYFHKAWKTTGYRSAETALDYMRQLFDLEKLREQCSKKGFAKQRRNKAGLILKQFKSWLEANLPAVAPQSPLGKAIRYTFDNWEGLVRYLEHPNLTPSNNGVENAIRPFVVGRKNWLFSTSVKGAESSAIIYSLIESAKLNGLSTYDYLLYIFNHIPYAETEEDYRKLLPFNLTNEAIKLAE